MKDDAKDSWTLLATILMTAIAVGLLVFVLVAILRPPPPQSNGIAIERTTSARFKVKSQGWFNAGYNANVREILIVTDTETGKEYIGITGVGVTEMVQRGKTKAEE